MRCHYLSDLHLESLEYEASLPEGDVLIIAGDLCNAKCLDPKRTDTHSQIHQNRVRRFTDHAVARFRHVLFIAGNHEHYDGIFDDTTALLRDNWPGVTVLDTAFVDIGGVRFIGTTLWTDFEGRSQDCLDRVRRKVGEFVLVKKSVAEGDEPQQHKKFQPEDALAEFDGSIKALRSCRDDGIAGPIVVISHHAPSLLGLNPLHKGNGLDGAFASDLYSTIGELTNLSFWVHGHTHVQAKYRIGETTVLSNCRGFVSRDANALTFSTKKCFEL